jgi:hypothetical protein
MLTSPALAAGSGRPGRDRRALALQQPAAGDQVSAQRRQPCGGKGPRQARLGRCQVTGDLAEDSLFSG